MLFRSTLKTELATNDIRPVHLITIGFSTPVNFTDCSFSLTSDISTGSLTIEPPLTTAVSSSNIQFDNVPFTVYLTNDVQEFGSVGNDKDGNILYQFELDVEESL